MPSPLSWLSAWEGLLDPLFLSLPGQGDGGDLLAGGEGRLPQTPPATSGHQTWVSKRNFPKSLASLV